MPIAKSVRKPAAAPAKKSAAVKRAPAPKGKAKPVALPAPVAESKPKLVRDSFTIPKAEYAVLESLKERGAGLARPVKKSELLRAGIKALQSMSDKAFLAALGGVPSLKTGRPKGVEAEAAPGKSRK